jgi:hypothetical protein
MILCYLCKATGFFDVLPELRFFFCSLIKLMFFSANLWLRLTTLWFFELVPALGLLFINQRKRIYKFFGISVTSTSGGTHSVKKGSGSGTGKSGTHSGRSGTL